jgi:hypothetical protein
MVAPNGLSRLQIGMRWSHDWMLAMRSIGCDTGGEERYLYIPKSLLTNKNHKLVLCFEKSYTCFNL